MSIASMTAASRLASIAGPAHVISESHELAAYEVGGNRPTAVVLPGSAEEATEIVKFAAGEKLAIVPCGARTKFSMGLPPRAYDLALDLTRLNRIAAYDPADLTLAVEPGVTLHKLAGVLAEHKQWLPLAVPYMRRTTVGGTIASGVDSHLRQMHGTPRDYILGMEFITGQGVAAKSGGRVVKNVSGYDMHKLMIGALGTLGVLTKINFRTFPLPLATRGFLARFDKAAKALELRHSLARSPLTPQSLEIFTPSAARVVSSDAAARIAPEPMDADVLSMGHWTLAAEFSGNEKVLDRCERDLLTLADKCGASNFTVLTASQMAAVLANAAWAAETNSLPWAAMARGLGIIYFALLPRDRGDDARRRVIQATDQILPESAALGGHASIPWSPAEWKSSLKVWGLERPDLEQMRKLKNLFDPAGTLSPGRFMGGM